MESSKQQQIRHYDRYKRDPQSKKFYDSTEWRKVRKMKLSRDPLCEVCLQVGRCVMADMVHHSIPVKSDRERLNMAYLVSLCHGCHNKVEGEIEKESATN
jgi:5-methylcytosine-specific restriction enzyme A